MDRMAYLCTAIRKERAITLRFERASKFILTTEFCSKLPSQNSVAFTLKQNDAPKNLCLFVSSDNNKRSPQQGRP